MDFNLIELEGGSFKMGTNSSEGFEDDLEGPEVQVKLNPFAISKYTVTNSQFQEFFLDTGYITDAEKYGSSFVFHFLLNDEQKDRAKKAAGTDRWYEVPEASWRKPEGIGSSIKDRMDHPVVHISWNDANYFAKWANLRLPTEAEWEFAARANTMDQNFPWGKDLYQDNKFHANTYQGNFPQTINDDDGYIGTAPVTAYEPNDFGLYQVCGNVYEWCLNPGRISLKIFKEKSTKDFIEEASWPSDELKSMKGGSFLCSPDYCKRYRIPSRNSNTANSSSNNLGFRLAKTL